MASSRPSLTSTVAATPRPISLNGDLENFENNKLGEPVRLVTFTVDTDDEGNEAVAFGFEKV